MGFAERTETSNERRARTIAEAQFGLVSRAQAMDLGFSPAAVARRVRAGYWDRLLPGVFRIAGAPTSARQAAMAAALWGGADALVSHGAAATLWNIDGIRTRKIEIWVPPSRSAKLDAILIHRGTRLDRTDRTSLGPIPITTPIRTLIDVAGRLEDDRLATAMESIFRQKLGTSERLTARLEALSGSGRPGTGRLQRLLLSRAGAPSESRLEARVWLLLGRTGLPMPRRQHWVVAEKDRYRVDFAWPEAKLAIECDGWEHHSDRVAFAKDRRRLSGLVAVGWRVLIVTWEMCRDEPDQIVGWVRAAMSRAA
jgi:very-short-patch-repair endonuclease